MFYVVRVGAGLQDYHSAFSSLAAAQNYAENLKAALGHQYRVDKVETVWTTKALAEAMEE